MINVNLIAERESQRRRGEAAGRVAFFVAVLAFVGVMGVGTLQQSRLRATRASIVSTQIEIERLQGQKDEVDRLQRQIDSKQPLVELLRSARDSEAKWCAALKSISESRPPHLALQTVRSSTSLRPRVKQEGEKNTRPKEMEGFMISGNATTGNLVGQFITNLQKTPSFGDVYLQYTRKRGGANREETYQFEIQALLATGEASP